MGYQKEYGIRDTSWGGWGTWLLEEVGTQNLYRTHANCQDDKKQCD